MAERITFDKPYDLKGEMNPRMISNVDEMLGQLYWAMAQLENKLSNNEGLLSGLNTSVTQEKAALGAINLTRWLKGPWILDDPNASDPDVAILDPASLVGGTTYHDYAPDGVDTAVGLQQGATGAGDITLTGLKAPANPAQKRFFFFRNNDSSTNFVLKHENSGSLAVNRFRLPSSQDITMAVGQNIWLYYDPTRQRWTAAITPHTSGGLASSTILENFVDLTAAQVQGLTATPVTLIAAQGAGKVIHLLRVLSVCDVAVAFNATQSATVRYAAPTGITLASLSLVANTATGKRISVGSAGSGTVNGTDPANQAIEIVGSTTPTTGSFNGTGCRVSFAYYVEDAPY